MMGKYLKATHIMHNVDVPSEEQGVFIYDDETIIYFVVRTNAKHKQDLAESKQQLARKIRIKVHPDLRVIVGAPIDAEQSQIHSAVLKRARWIWQNIQDFRAQKAQVPTKQYISGDAQFYLGKRYQLKIHNDNAQAVCVKLSKGKLNVYLTQTNNSTQPKESVKALIEQWYQYRAKVIFHQRLSELLPKVSWVKGIPAFRIMAMKKQWGSCSTKGTLMLNPHLVKAPKACIDYVILHELCHIAEHNHSEKFWRLLTQVMPNWKAVKLELDGMAELYLNE